MLFSNINHLSNTFFTFEGIDINNVDLKVKVFCTTCCKEKKKDIGLLPANERYLSERIDFVFNKSEEQQTPFFILSGKYGLIPSDHKIPFYDKKLEKKEVSNMLDLVVGQLRKYDIDEIHFYAIPSELNVEWEPYHQLMELACKKAEVDLFVIYL